MRQLLATIGQELNMTKCEALLYGGTDDDRARFLDIAQRLGIKVATGGIDVVGLPVGSKAYTTAWAARLADKVIAQQALLATTLNEPASASVPRYQALLTAFRLTGPASFTWAARGLHPDVTLTAAARVDDALRDLALSNFNLLARYNRLGADEKTYADQRLNASKQTGGLALGGCAIAQDGAFLGGLASLARTLTRAYPNFRLSQLRPDADAVYQRIRVIDPDAKIVKNNAHVDDIANGIRSGKVVQHAITNIKHDDVHNRMKTEWGVSNRTANLVASCGSASAAVDGWCRWLESRLSDAEMRTGISLMLNLPQTDYDVVQTDAATCVCGATGEANPPTGEHAFLCIRAHMRQQQATDNHVALAIVLQTLPGCKVEGPRIVNKDHMRRRPLEPTFAQAVNSIGIKLVKPADANRRFDIGFTTGDGAAHYVDCKSTATIQGKNIKAACDKQGYAVKVGDRDKYSNYHKSISNLSDKRHRIWFATIDNNGTMSKNFTKLVQLVARAAYPGYGDDGRYDVDGLRSRCVARLRVSVGCGVWRANHKVLGAWALANDKS